MLVLGDRWEGVWMGGCVEEQVTERDVWDSSCQPRIHHEDERKYEDPYRTLSEEVPISLQLTTYVI